MKIDNKKLVQILIQDSLLKNAKIYGIEGLEQKIKELYTLMPKLQNMMLEEYRRLFLK